MVLELLFAGQSYCFISDFGNGILELLICEIKLRDNDSIGLDWPRYLQ